MPIAVGPISSAPISASPIPVGGAIDTVHGVTLGLGVDAIITGPDAGVFNVILGMTCKVTVNGGPETVLPTSWAADSKATGTWVPDDSI